MGCWRARKTTTQTGKEESKKAFMILRRSTLQEWFGVPGMLSRGLPLGFLAENSRMSKLNGGRLGTNSLKENKRLTEWNSSSSGGVSMPEETVWETLSWFTLGGTLGVITQRGLPTPPIQLGFITQSLFHNGCVCGFIVYNCVISECTQTICERLVRCIWKRDRLLISYQSFL